MPILDSNLGILTDENHRTTDAKLAQLGVVYVRVLDLIL